MLRARHLQEHRLFDCYLAERQDEPVDPHVAEHLADCDACAGRYAELTGFMEDVRSDAAAESDAAFTPEHLRVQQQQIASRIEHIGRHARVISFPKSNGDHAPRAGFAATHRRSRWVAAAVAAGVFVGVALGASFEWERRALVTRSVAGIHQTPGTAMSAAPGLTGVDVASRPVPAVAPDTSSDIAADDAFLSELEVAADRPRARALQPFDDLTPHVREIRAVR